MSACPLAQRVDVVGEGAHEERQQPGGVLLPLGHPREELGDRRDRLLADGGRAVGGDRRELRRHLDENRGLAEEQRDERLGGGGADARVLVGEGGLQRADERRAVRLDVRRQRRRDGDGERAAELLRVGERVGEARREDLR